jgi:hypothetical protein
LAEQCCQDRADRIRQPGEDRKERIAGTGMEEVGGQKRTGRTRQPEQLELSGQDCRDRTPMQYCQDMTARCFGLWNRAFCIIRQMKEKFALFSRSALSLYFALVFLHARAPEKMNYSQKPTLIFLSS